MCPRKDRWRDIAVYWENNLFLKFGVKRKQILATIVSISTYSRVIIWVRLLTKAFFSPLKFLGK